MKLSVVRVIPIVFVIGLVAFLLSGVSRFKNAKHGFDYVVGDIVWFGFLVAALTLIVLVSVTLFRTVSNRRSTARA